MATKNTATTNGAHKPSAAVKPSVQDLDPMAHLEAARNVLVVQAYDAIKCGRRDEARLLVDAARVAKALALAIVERRTEALAGMAKVAGAELRRKKIEGTAVYWTDGDVIRTSIDSRGSLIRLVEKWLKDDLSDAVLAAKFVTMLRANAADFATLLLEMPPRPEDLAPCIEAVRLVVKVARQGRSRELAQVIVRRSLVKLGYPAKLAKDFASGIDKRTP